MTGKELTEFRKRMGWSKAEAARMLGTGRNQIANYETMPVLPRTLALACAAVAHGLPPYGSPVPGEPS
jgi:transcriptional regulator with XRE-family HTH domain